MPNPAHTISIYLCSDFWDMRAERAYLHAVVFRELQRRLGSRAQVRVVDLRSDAGSAEDAEGPAGLDRALAEIDRCWPWFLCLLGEGCGPPLAYYPQRAVDVNPWLAQRPPASRVELEVRQAVLRPDRLGAGLVYVRDPSFRRQVPMPRREEFLGGDADSAGRAAHLRLEVAESGRAVVKRYSPRWDPTPGKVAGLEALGEMVLADLEAALAVALDAGPLVTQARSLGDRILAALTTRDAAARPTPTPDRAPPSPKRPPYVDENVQFTVYRPRIVVPQRWYPLLAFAHLSERPPDAPPGTPDPVEEVYRQARQVLGAQAKEYQDVTQDSRAAVPREGEITLVPEVPGVKFNPPSRTFLWQESVHREEFRLCASPELDGRTARGRLTVYLGHVILADVSLTLRVDRNHRPAGDDPPEAERARPYRKIFGSYSHRDLHIVRHMEDLVRVFGDEYLRDWTHLRAGEVWDDRLLELIRQADVFQLFWSSNSMHSPYCRREWEYALSLGRPHFVRPTYWEEPLPMSPDGSLPPEQLRRLHFQRLFGEATRAGTRQEPPSMTVPFAPASSPPTPNRVSSAVGKEEPREQRVVARRAPVSARGRRGVPRLVGRGIIGTLLAAAVVASVFFLGVVPWGGHGSVDRPAAGPPVTDLERARARLGDGDYQAALKIYGQLETGNADNPALRAGRGEALWRSALQQLARENKPLTKEELNELPDVARARDDLTKASKTDPDALFWLGQMQEVLEGADAARRTYQQGLLLFPEHRRRFQAALDGLDILPKPVPGH